MPLQDKKASRIFLHKNHIIRHSMKKTLSSVLLLIVAVSAFAQSAYDEILENPQKAGGLYYLYPVTTSLNTKAPKGYEPFYISHYGRHGSRYLVSDEEYSTPYVTFKKAEENGALTAKGKDLAKRLEAAWKDARGRSGELTQIGVRQHHDIAQRMYKAFPQVFKGNPAITARSTTVMRCAHSMAAFCEGLKELNPNLDIPRESGRRYMSYMANTTEQASYFNRGDGPAAKRTAEFEKEIVKPERLMTEMFTDSAYAANIDARKLMLNLFRIAIDLPNTEAGITIDDIFTPQEIYDLWQFYNYNYYNHMSNPTSANGAVLDNARPLLRNIVESATSMIESGRNGADLRFGHDSCIVPLLGLMKVEGCYGSTDDPYKLHEVYADYKVSPMAVNLQLVFFRNKAGDVIVKLMHNEREVSIPVATDIAPFYHWKDVKEYFESILNSPETTKESL